MYNDKTNSLLNQKASQLGSSNLEPNIVRSMRKERQLKLQSLAVSLQNLQRDKKKRPKKTLSSKHLIGLLLAHSARAKRANAPKVFVHLQCLTPNGQPALAIQLG